MNKQLQPAEVAKIRAEVEKVLSDGKMDVVLLKCSEVIPDELSLLTLKKAAKILDVSPTVFQCMIVEGTAPTARLIGQRRRWKRSDIAAWEENLAKENQTLNPALG